MTMVIIITNDDKGLIHSVSIKDSYTGVGYSAKTTSCYVSVWGLWKEPMNINALLTTEIWQNKLKKKD